MIRKLRQPQYALAALVSLLAAVFLPRPANTGVWFSTLFEWLHVPVFGLVSLALLALTPPTWHRWQRFLAAFLGTSVLGVFTETVQIPMLRDASWEDINADVLGASGFLLIAAAIGRKSVTVVASVIAGAGILLWTLMPLGEVTIALLKRNAQFPVIFNGDIESERTFVSGINTRMESHEQSNRGETFTQVEFVKQQDLRIEVRDLVPDWSGYSNVKLIIDLPGDHELPLTIRIHDKAHRRGDQPHDDRFNRQLTISPGMNTLVVPLNEVKMAPKDRLMDMTRIEALILFSDNENAVRGMNLHEIRLD